MASLSVGFDLLTGCSRKTGEMLDLFIRARYHGVAPNCDIFGDWPSLSISLPLSAAPLLSLSLGCCSLDPALAPLRISNLQNCLEGKYCIDHFEPQIRTSFFNLQIYFRVWTVSPLSASEPFDRKIKMRKLGKATED